MDFNLTDKQQELKKTTADFLRKECSTTLVMGIIENEKAYLPRIWNKMVNLGWLGQVLPQKYGGREGNFLDLAILLEQMGYAALPGPFFSTVVLGGLPLLDIGNEEQKQEFLPKIAKGETLLTLALSELDAWYSSDSIKTRAISDKQGYVIKGTKMFVGDAHTANYLICAARTEVAGKDGISLFLVDSKSPGLTCTLLNTSAGDKQCEVILDNVRVPKESILGEFNQNGENVNRIMQRAAVAKCAEMVGWVQRVFELTLDRAKERIVFGRPLGSFQAIQHYIANMIVDVESMRFITYKAAWQISQGLDWEMDAAIAKTWCNDACQRVIDWGQQIQGGQAYIQPHKCTAACHQIRGQQIHGGTGYCQPHPMPLYFTRAKTVQSAFGSSDYYRELVAQKLGL